MKPSRLSQLARLLVGGSEQFRRNFIGMAAANILAQVIGVASLPFLTRLFTPEHFGVLSVFIAVHGMLLAIVTLRFDWLVPNARRITEVARLSILALIAIAVVTVLTVAALAGWLDVLGARFGLPGSQHGVLWYLPLAVAAGGLQLLLWSWHVQGGDLKPVGVSRAFQAVVTLLVSVAAGAIGFGAGGLVFGFVAGFIASLPLLLSGQGRLAVAIRGSRRADVRAEWSRQWRTAATASAVSIINTAMLLSMPFLLAQAYSVTIVGWYGLVMRVATAPVGLITNALVHSFWSDAARLARENPRELKRFYFASLRRLSVVGVAAVLVALAGPWYIGPIFGAAEWSGAGALLAAASPYLFALVVFSPTSHLMVYGRQGWQFWCDLGGLVAAAAAVLILGRLGHAAWVAVLAASTLLLVSYIVRFLLHITAINQLIARFKPQASPPSPSQD